MKALLWTLALAGMMIAGLGTASPARAATILLLTQESWEGSMTPMPAGLPDDKFITWATGLGYTVAKQVVTAPTNKAQIEGWITANNAGLVIIGPRNASGNYNDKQINAITTPMLALMAHAIRGDRLGWFSVNQGADNSPWTTELFSDPGHPWVQGLSQTFFTFPTGVGDTRNTTATTAGNGTVIAMLDTGTPGPGGDTVGIASWDAGVLPYSGSVSPAFGGRRVWFASAYWGRINANTPTTFDNWTADGKTSLARVMNDLLPVPEPATLALLGLGAGAMLLRRRR